MLKILVANSKGGAGKSTLATNLAAHYSVEGRNTVLVDADRQGSSLRWCEKRALHVNAVLGVPGLRRDWEKQVPADAERVIIDSAAGIRATANVAPAGTTAAAVAVSRSLVPGATSCTMHLDVAPSGWNVMEIRTPGADLFGVSAAACHWACRRTEGGDVESGLADRAPCRRSIAAR